MLVPHIPRPSRSRSHGGSTRPAGGSLTPTGSLKPPTACVAGAVGVPTVRRGHRCHDPRSWIPHQHLKLYVGFQGVSRCPSPTGDPRREETRGGGVPSCQGPRGPPSGRAQCPARRDVSSGADHRHTHPSVHTHTAARAHAATHAQARGLPAPRRPPPRSRLGQEPGNRHPCWTSRGPHSLSETPAGNQRSARTSLPASTPSVGGGGRGLMGKWGPRDTLVLSLCL